jgi:hypothetical protein
MCCLRLTHLLLCALQVLLLPQELVRQVLVGGANGLKACLLAAGQIKAAANNRLFSAL